MVPANRDPIEELVSELQHASYLIMPYDKGSYGKTLISGTFYDAIKYLKPIIALNTNDFRYFFDRFGDLGYLCESVDEMKQVILDIMDDPPLKRYSEQQQCLLDLRNFLHHDKQKDAFRALWE